MLWDLKQQAKWGLILGIWNFAWEESCPYTRVVANAMAKTPQSLKFCCCWTSSWLIPLYLGPSKFLTRRIISADTAGFARLSSKFTNPGAVDRGDTHPMVIHMEQLPKVSSDNVKLLNWTKGWSLKSLEQLVYIWQQNLGVRYHSAVQPSFWW